MRILIFSTLLLVVLSGCTTVKTQTLKVRIIMLASDAKSKSDACKEPIRENPKYSHIYEKFALSDNSISTQFQLSDTDTIVDSDINSIIDWYGEFQYCITSSIEDLGRIDPQLAIIGSKAMRKHSEWVNTVISTPQTYGTINRRIADIKLYLKSEGRKYGENLDFRLKEMESLEKSGTHFLSEVGQIAKSFADFTIQTIIELAEAQSQIAQSQAAYAASHPSYVVKSQIITTNCNWSGSYMSCQSY
jgi:hypothetical protein